MKRSRFTEEQIIAVLKEHELGAKTADLCRKHGISEATFYNWKSKYGGMDVSEAKRLGQLEDENGKLKRLLADAMLDNAALKDLLSKNGDARCEARGCRPYRLADASRLRSPIRPAMGKAAALRKWLRAFAHCPNRTNGENQPPDSSPRWIKDGGNVTPNAYFLPDTTRTQKSRLRICVPRRLVSS
jgi:putative transposase